MGFSELLNNIRKTATEFTGSSVAHKIADSTSGSYSGCIFQAKNIIEKTATGLKLSGNEAIEALNENQGTIIALNVAQDEIEKGQEAKNSDKKKKSQASIVSQVPDQVKDYIYKFEQNHKLADVEEDIRKTESEINTFKSMIEKSENKSNSKNNFTVEHNDESGYYEYTWITEDGTVHNAQKYDNKTK